MNFSNVVLIAPDSYEKSEVLKFQHPREGTEWTCLWMADTGSVMEIQQYTEKFRSWMINGEITHDAKTYICSVLDVIFLYLPFIKIQTNNYMSFSDLTTNQQYPSLSVVGNSAIVDVPEKIKLVADTKDFNSQTFYRYNEEKTLKWLQGKVHKLIDLLSQPDKTNTLIPAHNHVESIDKDCSSPVCQFCKKFILDLAVSMVVEYISLDLEKLLKSSMDIEDSENKCAPKLVNECPNVSSSNTGKTSSDSTNDYEAISKQLTQTHSEAKRLKTKKSNSVAGLRSITNFFNKK